MSKAGIGGYGLGAVRERRYIQASNPDFSQPNAGYQVQDVYLNPPYGAQAALNFRNH
jgi:hypothetical protein